ncbi:tail fiber assembly protein [Escherichia coli]|uniref:tail fiber assembly protein n=1 Tax=Escherichia coli TaxID=562 RepID=UPI0030C68171
MNAYFYSPSENAFYATAIRTDYIAAGTWPEDGVEVENRAAEAYMGDAPEGKVRAAGDNGLPCWVDIPPPTAIELVAQAEAKRENLLAEAKDTISLWQTELQLGIISDEDKASLIAWMKYIQALKAVDTSTAPDIEWPVKPE